MIRFGILGTSKIARTELLPAFSRTDSAKVTAIATRSNVVAAEKLAADFNIDKVYKNYSELLSDPEIDAVYIPLPNHLHKEWVLKAAEAGKHILCEKPAALNADEANEIKEACLNNKVIFVEAFMYRFHKQHEYVKELISNGTIGDIQFMRSSFSFNLASRDGNIKMNTVGGGAIYDVGCYAIHAIRNILNAEPSSVAVQGIKEEAHPVEGAAAGVLTFTNNILATFNVSFSLTKRAEYEVVGSKGRIIVPRAFRPDWYEDKKGLVILECDGDVKEEKFFTDQYKTEIDYISSLITQSSYTEANQMFTDVIENAKVLDACLMSIDKNKVCKINE